MISENRRGAKELVDIFFLIFDLTISVVSMVFMVSSQIDSAWGWCGTIIGGYLILKGRTKLGLKNN